MGDSRILLNGAWKAKDRPPVFSPVEFVVGWTEPTAANTGSRVAEADMDIVHNGTYTISVPGVYEKILVNNGRINITIPTGVTVRDCIVHMPPSSSQINGIAFPTDAYDNVVEYVTVDVPDLATATEQQSTCIRGRGFTAYRCNFSGAVDGTQVYTPSSVPNIRKAFFHGCYIHDLIVSDAPTQEPDHLTHNDDAQLLGHIEVEIIGCALHGGRTSCVIINTSVSGGYGNVTIEDNWLYGHPTQGSTINVATSAALPNLSIKRNRVDRNGHDSGQILAVSPHRVPSIFGAISGSVNGPNLNDWVYGPDMNYYMDDNSEVRIQAG